MLVTVIPFTKNSPGRVHMSAPNIDSDGLGVLIIDDSRTMRKIIIQLLAALKIFNVYEAESGVDAVERITQKAYPNPDFIICDLHMENMDGIEFLNHLRLHDIHIPVIVLTSDHNSLLHEVAAQVGAAKILIKPVSPQDLLSVIESTAGFSISAAKPTNTSSKQWS